MELKDVLRDRSARIIDRTLEALRRAHLAHYEALGPEGTKRIVESLYDVTLRTLETREARPILDHAAKVAEERFTGGFDLLEVQTAFNTLEESIWREIVQSLEPGQVAEALGLVSTVLGMGKDALARGYVAGAARVRAPSVDMRALFTRS